MVEKEITDLQPREMFVFSGYEWIALGVEEGGILSIKADGWTEAAFMEEGYGKTNNYLESTLRYELRTELLPLLNKNHIIPHYIEQSEREAEYDKVFLLSVEEYEKYKKYIPSIFGRYWTRTPAEENCVYCVYDEWLCQRYINNIITVRPAVILDPSKCKLRRTQRGNYILRK